MSTHGTILRENLTGAYHHFDSYPEGLGRALWHLLHTHFNGDVKQMLKVLIDEHPAGWSTIVDTDFALTPGYSDYHQRSTNSNQPECYCHGQRHEDPNPVRGLDAEWNYVFSEDGDTMTVYYGNQTHRDINLHGHEPDWRYLESELLGREQ
jgi:hypothetical protein